MNRNLFTAAFLFAVITGCKGYHRADSVNTDSSETPSDYSNLNNSPYSTRGVDSTILINPNESLPNDQIAEEALKSQSEESIFFASIPQPANLLEFKSLPKLLKSRGFTGSIRRLSNENNFVDANSGSFKKIIGDRSCLIEWSEGQYYESGEYGYIIKVEIEGDLQALLDFYNKAQYLTTSPDRQNLEVNKSGFTVTIQTPDNP